MKVRILKDTTLTVKAGQTVDVCDAEVARLLAMGRVSVPEQKTVPTEKVETAAKPKKSTKKG